MHDRRTGKTYRMVQALPENGAIIIVPSYPIRDYILNMLRDVRGSEIANRCRIIVIRNHMDIWQLDGLNKPVVFDHSFFENNYISQDVLEETQLRTNIINDYVRKKELYNV